MGRKIGEKQEGMGKVLRHRIHRAVFHSPAPVLCSPADFIAITLVDLVPLLFQSTGLVTMTPVIMTPQVNLLSDPACSPRKYRGARDGRAGSEEHVAGQVAMQNLARLIPHQPTLQRQSLQSLPSRTITPLKAWVVGPYRQPTP